MREWKREDLSLCVCEWVNVFGKEREREKQHSTTPHIHCAEQMWRFVELWAGTDGPLCHCGHALDYGMAQDQPWGVDIHIWPDYCNVLHCAVSAAEQGVYSQDTCWTETEILSGSHVSEWVGEWVSECMREERVQQPFLPCGSPAIEWGLRSGVRVDYCIQCI